MNPRYPRVAERALHRCEYYLAPEVAFNIAFEVEHIQPSSAGGLDGDDNGPCYDCFRELSHTSFTRPRPTLCGQRGFE